VNIPILGGSTGGGASGSGGSSRMIGAGIAGGEYGNASSKQPCNRSIGSNKKIINI